MCSREMQVVKTNRFQNVVAEVETIQMRSLYTALANCPSMLSCDSFSSDAKFAGLMVSDAHRGASPGGEALP